MSGIFSQVGKVGNFRALLVPIFHVFLIVSISISPIYPAFATTFNNPLVDASDLGDTKQVEKLIKAGTLPDSKGDFGTTALMRAAFRGNIELIHLLIESGAYINASDIGGETPLHLAAKNGHEEAVKALLDYGAFIDVPDKEKWTPLMRATLAKKTDVAKVLIERGADVSAVNNFNESALVHASIANVPDIAALITGSKKSKSIRPEQENMAIAYAKRKNHPKVEKLLTDFIENNNPSPSLPDKNSDEEKLSVFPTARDTDDAPKTKYESLSKKTHAPIPTQVKSVEKNPENTPVILAEADKSQVKAEKTQPAIDIFGQSTQPISDEELKNSSSIKKEGIKNNEPSSITIVDPDKTPWKTQPKNSELTTPSEIKPQEIIPVKENKSPLISISKPEIKEEAIPAIQPGKEEITNDTAELKKDSGNEKAPTIKSGKPDTVVTDISKDNPVENNTKENTKVNTPTPSVSSPATVYGPPMPTEQEKISQAKEQDKKSVVSGKQEEDQKNADLKSTDSKPLPAQVKQSDSGNVFYVQLGTFKSDNSAELAWDKIYASNNDILAKLNPNIVQTIISSAPGDIVYRLRAGTLPAKSDADETCKKLRDRKVECNVVEITNVTIAPAKTTVSAQAKGKAETNNAPVTPVNIPSPSPSSAPPAETQAKEAIISSPAYPKLNDTAKAAIPSENTEKKEQNKTESKSNVETLPWRSGSAPVRTTWSLPADAIMAEPVKELSSSAAAGTSTAVTSSVIPPITPAAPVQSKSLDAKVTAPETKTASTYFRMTKPETVSKPATAPVSGYTPPASQPVQSQPIALDNNSFMENKDKIRSEVQDSTKASSLYKQTNQTPVRPKKEYDEFYKQVQSGVKEAPVSEAVMVPDETYFLNKSQLSKMNEAPKPYSPVTQAATTESGTWLNITNLPDEAFANDYGMRMFKYDESLGNVTVNVIKPVTPAGTASMKVGPVPPAQADTLCSTVKAGGFSCSVTGNSAGNLSSGLPSQTKPYAPQEAQTSSYWINLGTFASTSEAEYYWMFIKEDNSDILSSLQFEMPDAPSHGEFGKSAVQLRTGPFSVKQRASQLCNIMRYRNIACLVTE